MTTELQEHEVELDYVPRSRYTCYTCDNETLLRQPYMNFDKWVDLSSAFLAKHSPTKWVKRSMTFQISDLVKINSKGLKRFSAAYQKVLERKIGIVVDLDPAKNDKQVDYIQVKFGSYLEWLQEEEVDKL